MPRVSWSGWGWGLHLYKLGSVCREQFPEKGIQIHSVCQPLTRQGEAWASARQEGIPVHTDLLTVIRSLETKELTKNSKQSDLSWVASEAVLLQRVLDTETALASFCYSLKSSFYFSRLRFMLGTHLNVLFISVFEMCLFKLLLNLLLGYLCRL